MLPFNVSQYCQLYLRALNWTFVWHWYLTRASFCCSNNIKIFVGLVLDLLLTASAHTPSFTKVTLQIGEHAASFVLLCSFILSLRLLSSLFMTALQPNSAHCPDQKAELGFHTWTCIDGEVERHIVKTHAVFLMYPQTDLGQWKWETAVRSTWLFLPAGVGVYCMNSV